MPIIKFISLSSHGSGISGGDRIWIEFVRFWQKQANIHLVTWDEGLAMFKRQAVNESKNLEITLVKDRLFKSSFLISYLARIVKGVIWAVNEPVDKPVIIYSSSEFWMDSFPAVILKLRNKKNFWVATWFQTAPGLFQGFGDQNRDNKYRLSAFLYWLVQMPIKPLIEHLADAVLVNNELEKKQFNSLKKKIIVVLGAVRTDEIDKWKKTNKKASKKYDAVFQGRLHPQKGVIELIEIWKKVVQKLPQAKLAIIGDGPLMEKVKLKIINYKLQKNVVLKGYLFDGPEKYQIFAESKLVLHPAFFDSGGMAAAEAMAFGLPAIGFDLPSYKSYYPKGMVKIPIGNNQKFANKIINLLNNPQGRVKTSKAAMKYIYSDMNWNKRADEILENISK